MTIPFVEKNNIFFHAKWLNLKNDTETKKAWLIHRIVLPADTRGNNNVIITSKRRRFDVMITSLLRHVSVWIGRIEGCSSGSFRCPQPDNCCD